MTPPKPEFMFKEAPRKLLKDAATFINEYASPQDNTVSTKGLKLTGYIPSEKFFELVKKMYKQARPNLEPIDVHYLALNCCDTVLGAIMDDPVEMFVCGPNNGPSFTVLA